MSISREEAIRRFNENNCMQGARRPLHRIIVDVEGGIDGPLRAWNRGFIGGDDKFVNIVVSNKQDICLFDTEDEYLVWADKKIDEIIIDSFNIESFKTEAEKWLNEQKKIALEDPEDLYRFDPIDWPAFTEEVIPGKASIGVYIRVYGCEGGEDAEDGPKAVWFLMPEYDGGCDYYDSSNSSNSGFAEPQTISISVDEIAKCLKEIKACFLDAGELPAAS